MAVKAEGGIQDQQRKRWRRKFNGRFEKSEHGRLAPSTALFPFAYRFLIALTCVCTWRQVVDTTLVRLLAEERETEELLSILEGPNDCVIQHVEHVLLESGLYQILADIYLKRGEIAKTLEIWTKYVGVSFLFPLLWSRSDADLFIVRSSLDSLMVPMLTTRLSRAWRRSSTFLLLLATLSLSNDMDSG